MLTQANGEGRYVPLRPMCDPRAVIYKARGGSSEMEDLAASLEPKLAKAVLAALEKVSDSVKMAAIVKALEAGNVADVVALLDTPEVAAAYQALSPALQQTVYASGMLGAAAINLKLRGAVFAFDQLNPVLIQWLQTYHLGLIKQISEQTKAAVRDELLAGMQAGKNPKAVARHVKDIVGLTQTQAKAVSNYRKELETFHLRQSAAGYNLGAKIDRVNGTQVLRPDDDGTPKDGIDERRLRDFRFDGQLKRAMETGKPLSKDQIDKMVAAYRRKYLAYRSRTIARTEAMRTTNVGVQEAWRQAIASGKMPEALVRKTWLVAKDERLCRVCAPIPTMNPKRGIPLGAQFATPKLPVMLPPAHPNCRCTVAFRVLEPEMLKG